MKIRILASLMMLMAGCSGAQTNGGEEAGQTQNELKRLAAQNQAEGSAAGDVCGQRQWYGDGVCDTFCQFADTADCGVGCGGVVCALFIEESNGYCSRRDDDPCIAQDPDCGGSAMPTEPAYPGDDPVVCAAISEAPDGVCKRDPGDPCRFQDPDCPVDGGSGTEPTNPSGPGSTPPSEPGGSGDQPGDSGNNAGTEPSDVACTLLIEVADGVCRRDSSDPCIFQDPDCDVK